ncbi:MAG: serine protease [Betaproteobacteria bacterium]
MRSGRAVAAARVAATFLAAILLTLQPRHSRAASLEDTITRIKPSIVAVGSFQQARSPAFAFHGTGFVVGDGTLVATNAHVVPEKLDAEHFEGLAVIVRSGSAGEGQRRDARVVATDKDHDIVVLRIAGDPLPALAFVDPGAVREGRLAAFTGFPIGATLGLVPVTHRAMVSAITPIAMPSANADRLDPKVVRRIQAGAFKVLQLDATAYPGNSGSPLYDAATGEVMGILNMVFVKGTKEAALSQPSGISFAIPAEYLRELIERVKD